MTDDEIDKWIEANIRKWIDDGWDPSIDAEFETDGAHLGLPRALSKARALLHQRSPNEFLRNKFLLEARVLAQLSKHIRFREIRLADDGEPWPDGYARTDTGG